MEISWPIILVWVANSLFSSSFSHLTQFHIIIPMNTFQWVVFLSRQNQSPGFSLHPHPVLKEFSQFILPSNNASNLSQSHLPNFLQNVRKSILFVPRMDFSSKLDLSHNDCQLKKRGRGFDLFCSFTNSSKKQS
jgi:hypothetical protein